MRRGARLLMLILVVLALIPVGVVNGAVTAQEWDWIVDASEKEQAGDMAGAMDLWAKLVASTRTHDFDACGNYAQKLGRARDTAGQYPEAVAAFADELYCWGQFPNRAQWVLWDQRRAEQIQPELRAFVGRSTDSEYPGQLAKHEPAFGTMLGGTIDKDLAVANDPRKVAQAYGKPYAMVLVYARWNESLPVISTRNARAAGAALQVAWEPSEGLDAVTDSAYARTFARSLKDYGGPVFVRFAAEMNGAWTPWYGDPAKYKDKFALMAQILREEAPNVAMVWSPGYVGDDPLDDYYPGDQWVDWVGINVYHEAYFQGNPGSKQMLADIFYQGKRSNPLDKFKQIYATYAKRKPIMLSETGFGWASRVPFQDESAWAAETLERVYTYAPLLYPRIKAVAYFNVDFMANPGIEGTSHYVLSGNKAISEAYRKATASDWYLGSPTGKAQRFWRPVELSSLLGPTRLSAYVNLVGGPSRVEYVLDGQVMATATQIPWEADVDFSGLTGPHTLIVRAYDQQGRVGAGGEYRFDSSAIRVDFNGRYLDFDQPPVNLDGRVLVPARVILEALGAEIGWEAETRTVIARKDGHILHLQIDNPIPTRDGQPLAALSVPAQIIGNRTLVPARFVAENYQMEVKWDQATRTVIIRPLP